MNARRPLQTKPVRLGLCLPRVLMLHFHVWIEGLRGNQQTAIERAKLLTFIRKSTITFRTTLHTEDLSAIEYQVKLKLVLTCLGEFLLYSLIPRVKIERALVDTSGSAFLFRLHIAVTNSLETKNSCQLFLFAENGKC